MAERSVLRSVWSEGPAVVELGAYGIAFPWFGLLPRGDEHPVMVLPGLTSSDNATIPLRAVLRRLKYQAHGWNLGVNRGPDVATRRGMQTRLEELHERYEEPVSLVGWSLGGVYARGLARHNPRLVRQVITLGSPFRAVEAERSLALPPVPCTAIFSKSDSIVPWRIAIDDPGPQREQI